MITLWPFIASLALAAAPEPPKPADAKPQAGGPSSSEPTLDDLLGLPGDKKPATPDTRPDTKPEEKPATTDLDRQLATQPIEEQFEQAVSMMGEAAERLGKRADAGLETQRLQEEILRKLDKLIDDAQKNQSQSKSKGKPKPNQDQQQQQQSQNRQQQQQQQQQSQQANAANQAGNSTGQGTPPRVGGSATWGELPPHVREALSQGLSDRFSSAYRAMTEEYYRRLAEDRSTPRASTPPEGGSR